MSILSYTTSYRFKLINYASRTWHEDEYSNWELLDSILDATVGEAIPFALDIGAINTAVVNYTPAETLVVGRQYSFSSGWANTGAITLNINSTGAKPVLKDGAPLVAGVTAFGKYIKVVYDGTSFLIIDPASVAIENNSITPAKLSVGKPSWDASGNFFVPGNFQVLGASAQLPASTQINNREVFKHNTAYGSAKVFVSSSAPTGGDGADGDIWIKI